MQEFDLLGFITKFEKEISRNCTFTIKTVFSEESNPKRDHKRDVLRKLLIIANMREKSLNERHLNNLRILNIPYIEVFKSFYVINALRHQESKEFAFRIHFTFLLETITDENRLQEIYAEELI